MGLDADNLETGWLGAFFFADVASSSPGWSFCSSSFDTFSHPTGVDPQIRHLESPVFLEANAKQVTSLSKARKNFRGVVAGGAGLEL